jgi:GT2 family glycosyltransferase
MAEGDYFIYKRASSVNINIVVGIPTVGRATILCETLRELSKQTRRPDAIVVCGGQSTDVAGADVAAPGVRLLLSQPGLPRQRNAIIDAVMGTDVLVFFDDDFLPHQDYLAEIERGMSVDPNIVVATGHVLADGIGGPGLSPNEGRAILSCDDGSHLPSVDTLMTPTFSGYGCNMAIRLAPMRDHHLRFDERLPLYGWQEDVDLSRRLAAYGSVVRIGAARGVHLGVKSGRASGVRLGYSQVANPLYLSRKRCGYPLRRAMKHIVRNLAMNIARATWPEPYIDRRGRLRGNFLAMCDLITGRMIPERILDL